MEFIDMFQAFQTIRDNKAFRKKTYLASLAFQLRFIRNKSGLSIGIKKWRFFG